MTMTPEELILGLPMLDRLISDCVNEGCCFAIVPPWLYRDNLSKRMKLPDAPEGDDTYVVLVFKYFLLGAFFDSVVHADSKETINVEDFLLWEESAKLVEREKGSLYVSALVIMPDDSNGTPGPLSIYYRRVLGVVHEVGNNPSKYNWYVSGCKREQN